MAPKFVGTKFYKWPIPGKFQTFGEELDLLDNTIHHTKEDIILPSNTLMFNAAGRELQRLQPMIKHLSYRIGKHKLLEKIASALHRLLGEQRDAEYKDKEDLISLTMQYIEVFSKGGRTKWVKEYKAIKNTSDNPLPQAQYLCPAGLVKRALIEETMNQLLAWDVIELSTSETASPMVLVWQNNKWRFCVDFHQLNSVIIGDAYPMLRFDYMFSTLAESKYFMLLDALKGYHQVEIEAADREKSAFVSHKGLYQYKRSPFGLKNAPAQFQRLMDRIIGGLRWQTTLVYIGDLLLYSTTWQNHLSHLETIMDSAKDAGLVFSLEKYSFGFNNVK